MRKIKDMKTYSTSEAIAEVNKRLGTELHYVTMERWINGHREGVPQPSIQFGNEKVMRRWSESDVDRLTNYVRKHPPKRTGRPPKEDDND
jgi:hypothetical protein